MKIVILPQVAGNKGDRAILYFMLQEIFKHCENAKITIATSNPVLWENHPFSEKNVHFVHRAWLTYMTRIARAPRQSFRRYFWAIIQRIKEKVYKNVGYTLLRSALVNEKFVRLAKVMCSVCNPELWRAINEADAVVTTGGHRLTTLLQPDVVGTQTFDMASVVLAKKRFILWSQTIGGFDFKKEINRKLIDRILKHAERIYIRDDKSEQYLEQFGINKDKIYKTYDSVFGLRDVAEEFSAIAPGQRQKVLGISVYTGRSGREIEDEPYLAALGEFVGHVAQDGYRVKFFPMHINDHLEHRFFDEIISRSGRADVCEIVSDKIDTVEHLQELAKCQIFVGHKTHSIIFALTVSTPLITIAYHFKSLDFMSHFGLREYGFPESQTTAERLINLYAQVKSNLDKIYEKERVKSAEMSSKVQSDFYELLDSLNYDLRK